MKKKLVISFSGGKTSAYMLWWLHNEWQDRHNWEMLTVFANTGKEVEGTLFFVDECSQEWDIPIIWIEGYPSDKGKGWAVNHKIVTYETASRNGEPFEAMIKRLGIPNQKAPFCSPQLKREAIKSYLKGIGWKDYYIAIGIRYDEPERIVYSKKQKIIYPLANINPVTKRNVSEWWAKQPFDLNIHPEDGNCDRCWKKSFVKLARAMNRKPDTFDWWDRMAQQYGMLNPRIEGEQQNFYRGNKSVLDIRKMAEISHTDLKQLAMFEVLDGCNQSCEVF